MCVLVCLVRLSLGNPALGGNGGGSESKEEGGRKGRSWVFALMLWIGDTMGCHAVPHDLMNRGHTYRSKMACTPARALRLFSSLEGGGFSAGPGAGIAGGRNGRRLADHESCNLSRETNPF